MRLKVSVLTLFPEMFPGPLGYSLAGKALEEGEWGLKTINIRDFSQLKHQKVDDTPFGGGNGLIMRADVVDAAVAHAVSLHHKPRLIYFSPRGKPLTQQLINEVLAACHPGQERQLADPGYIHFSGSRVPPDGRFRDDRSVELILLCGRYEGIDQRVIDHWQMEEICIGDYILSGGELAALVLLDALTRKIILKNQETLATESFEVELLEYPQYTVPREFHNMRVPDVLLSGHHGAIDEWRHRESVQITKERRPDLWARYLRNR